MSAYAELEARYGVTITVTEADGINRAEFTHNGKRYYSLAAVPATPPADCERHHLHDLGAILQQVFP